MTPNRSRSCRWWQFQLQRPPNKSIHTMASLQRLYRSQAQLRLIVRIFFRNWLTVTVTDLQKLRTPQFYTNNSLTWNFKMIHHCCIIDQVHIVQLHCPIQSNILNLFMQRDVSTWHKPSLGILFLRTFSKNFDYNR